MTELDLLKKEVQQLRTVYQQQKRDNLELKDQLALVHPPGEEIQTTSAQLTTGSTCKLLLIHVHVHVRV